MATVQGGKSNYTPTMKAPLPMGAMAATSQGQSPQQIAMDAYPTYTPGYDPLSMSAVDEMKRLDPMYTQGFNRLRSEALRKGPSSWLNMSLAQDALKQQDAIEKARQMNASRTAESENRLAASGGLSSGARERVQEQGQNDFMNMNQDLARSGKLADIGMRVSDEQQRVGKLENLTGMEQQKENAWATAKDKDVQNVMNERKRASDFQMDLYKTRMENAAAERQAQATENAGKK